LLERFLARRDEAAFELLVRRHGPMVLGVCRRAVRNEADAEDAFQATFLVFVLKAQSIRPRANVGNWLYGVAHNTALKARAMNLRRRHKEREAGEAGHTTPDETWSPLLELLDEELSALPARYRTPIVLCDLEGLPYRVAAARLGCPRGTLSGRLTRGRALLARRIARHGLPLPAGALAAAFARHAAAAVPPTLLWTALRFASPLNAFSPSVNTLAE
jgi:RNA polymerase sigma-70 factor (ECF subfamily)